MDYPTSNHDSKWLAIDVNSNGVISQGNDPSSVMTNAKETGKEFFMQYVPDPNGKFIF